MLGKQKQIRYQTALALVSLSTICLTGCSTIPDYPSQFPPLVPMVEDTTPRPPMDRFIVPHEFKCEELSGRYLDKGTAITPDGKALEQVSLTQILHRNDPSFKSTMPVDTVVVIGPKQGLLKIQSWKGTEQIASWEQTSIESIGDKALEPDSLKTHYNCQRGYVTLTKSSFGGFTPIGFGAGGEFLGMRKAVDGSLIVFNNANLGAIILVVPIWYTDHAWYRFPVVREEERPKGH